ncbi:MAG TPA: nuclear transport factor 2 family protein [Solirubrobacterales bacterium]|jgi:hypothetical protein
MSHEDVEIVKRAHPDGVDLVQLFAATTPASAPGIDLTVYAADCLVEFDSRGPAAVGPPSSSGVLGLAEGWLDWLEPWESYHIEVEEFIDAGDDVISLARVRAQSARGGVPVEHSPAALWSVRHGKIVRVRFYLERAEALEAAGITGHR